MARRPSCRQGCFVGPLAKVAPLPVRPAPEPAGLHRQVGQQRQVLGMAGESFDRVPGFGPKLEAAEGRELEHDGSPHVGDPGARGLVPRSRGEGASSKIDDVSMAVTVTGPEGSGPLSIAGRVPPCSRAEADVRHPCNAPVMLGKYPAVSLAAA